jgi:hypothetical protein
VNSDDIPLSFFEVDCDGSACGSGDTGLHVHPAQHAHFPVGRVTVRNGERVGYGKAEGITRLATIPGGDEQR